jgi:hypothetical protein
MIPKSCLFKMQFHGSSPFWKVIDIGGMGRLCGVVGGFAKDLYDLVLHFKRCPTLEQKVWVEGSISTLVAKVLAHFLKTLFFQAQSMGMASTSTRLGYQDQTL